jgi:hypothetical protein
MKSIKMRHPDADEPIWVHPGSVDDAKKKGWVEDDEPAEAGFLMQSEEENEDGES